MRLVQLFHPQRGRAVAMVEEPHLCLLRSHRTVYDLAMAAIAAGRSLVSVAQADLGTNRLEYDPVYRGQAEWKLLPPLDHPREPGRCLVSGTGLTHTASARARQAMHVATGQVTDSMRMFEWGVQGGKPVAGQIGVQPEWFYKGDGQVLRAHLDPLTVPTFGGDGGEEAEIVGLYLIDPAGVPRRVGLATGNEFSDHEMEKQNYLYLAPSKLRDCAVGPELGVEPGFGEIRGTVQIERAGQVIWSHPLASGEGNMSHSLANLEHHQFKYDRHRRPGDVHIYFFGADAFSHSAGVSLKLADVMVIQWDCLGRALRNPLRVVPPGQGGLWSAKPI